MATLAHPQDSSFSPLVVGMVGVPLLQELETFVFLDFDDHLKIWPIAGHVVSHLIYDRPYFRGRDQNIL